MGQLEGVKHYEGWVVEGGREVPAETAKRLANHAKAFFGADGRLDRVELYAQAEMFRVDYYGDAKDEEVKAAHLRTYKNVRFEIHRDSARVQDFKWEDVHSYTASGVLEGFTTILQDRKNRGWMEVKMDKNKKIREVTKFYWEAPDGDLLYTFEYDSKGVLLRAYDLTYAVNREHYQKPYHPATLRLLGVETSILEPNHVASMDASWSSVFLSHCLQGRCVDQGPIPPGSSSFRHPDAGHLGRHKRADLARDIQRSASKLPGNPARGSRGADQGAVDSSVPLWNALSSRVEAHPPQPWRMAAPPDCVRVIHGKCGGYQAPHPVDEGLQGPSTFVEKLARAYRTNCA
ncbi:uncharacterized protein STAUR_4397 [Stigmatella aurantiaca DW4/3-1]|uniref:Uncharacterized protein n=1 Tax=Stigmatella aurantiaca (strain DW4/3-1) TaxID=378806 RepID=E3FU37_STIAD|nr:uncharacterized protein STAUR_4397 [Stigmatella aurantiaca DW4/3-1]